MDPVERIRIITLLEKVRENEEYAKVVGVEDKSHYREKTSGRQHV